MHPDAVPVVRPLMASGCAVRRCIVDGDVACRCSARRGAACWRPGGGHMERRRLAGQLLEQSILRRCTCVDTHRRRYPFFLGCGVTGARNCSRQFCGALDAYAGGDGAGQLPIYPQQRRWFSALRRRSAGPERLVRPWRLPHLLGHTRAGGGQPRGARRVLRAPGRRCGAPGVGRGQCSAAPAHTVSRDRPERQERSVAGRILPEP